MLSVCVYINHLPITLETAINIGRVDNGDVCMYRLSDNTVISHDQRDGAEGLAIKLLQHKQTKKGT